MYYWFHKIPVVVSRFGGAAQNERKCNLCKTNFIRGEFHYIFQPKALENERSTYINKKFLGCPNTLVMEIRFNSEDHTILSKL